MLQYIAFTQIFVFFFFILFERFFPARHFRRAKGFAFWWVVLVAASTTWFSFVFIVWLGLPEGPFSVGDNAVLGGLTFYFLYSLINYWWHRARHRIPFLWRNIHKFHHSPQKMEVAVAFFKHPFEFMSNSLVITLIAFLFSASAEMVVLALAIEGCLETYHHSNIKTPYWLRNIGYLIQTPEMHLVHHQRGLHRYNYAAFLWDSVFNTVKIPKVWHGKQGFDTGDDIKSQFLLSDSFARR